ncbi:MAG: AMP-binding protein [Lishizhenia sp.]
MHWNKFTFLKNGESTQAELLHFLEEWNSNKDYIVQYTSGSTGKPKEIRVKKDVMIASALATNNYFDLTEKSKALLCISPKYIGGKMMIVRAIVANMELLVAEISSRCLAYLEQPIDFCAMVPMQAEEQLHLSQFELIKTLILGGAPVSELLEDRLKLKSTKSYATFGMTETVSHVAVRKLDGKNKPYNAVGDSFFAQNNQNCLVINSPHLGIAKLLTNDVVNLVNSSAFYWKGRADFVINSGGVKIHPEEVERKIKNKRIKENIIVFGWADSKLGSKVQLVVEGEDIDFSQEWKSDLHPYEIPKNIYFLNRFEYTASGKIDRSATIAKINFEG